MAIAIQCARSFNHYYIIFFRLSCGSAHVRLGGYRRLREVECAGWRRGLCRSKTAATEAGLGHLHPQEPGTLTPHTPSHHTHSHTTHTLTPHTPSHVCIHTSSHTYICIYTHTTHPHTYAYSHPHIHNRANTHSPHTHIHAQTHTHTHTPTSLTRTNTLTPHIQHHIHFPRA